MPQGFQAGLKGVARARAEQQFTGGNAADPIGQLVCAALRQVHHGLGYAQPGQRAARAGCLMHGQQHRFGFFAEQFAVGQGARGDHPHHLALHRPLAGDFAHLFANCHRFTQFDQPGQVAFNRMKGHTRHHHRFTRRVAAPCQGDVQQAGGFFSIGKKQLVKIAHAVEQQGVGEPGFERQVLLHHRRVV